MSEFDIANRLIRWEERVTIAPKFISVEHAYIHAGNAFQVNISATASTGMKKYVLKTDVTKYVHLRPVQIAIPSGECILGLFETTLTSSGSAVEPVHNHNRNSAITAQSVLYSGATSTSGTLLDKFVVYGGSGPGKMEIGASERQIREWVLRRNTGYRLQLETTVDFNMNLFWYEEADG